MYDYLIQIGFKYDGLLDLRTNNIILYKIVVVDAKKASKFLFHLVTSGRATTGLDYRVKVGKVKHFPRKIFDYILEYSKTLRENKIKRILK